MLGFTTPVPELPVPAELAVKILRKAFPVPAALPIALNLTPTLLLAAPHKTQLVVPTLLII